MDSLIRVVRDQIGRGADWIKVYADTAMGGVRFGLRSLRRSLVGLSDTAKFSRGIGIGPCHFERGYAPGGPGRCRDDRAWRRR